ncbi:hypothetical protein BH11BAC4_BH11BAC4_05140 [soil metagenome]
MPNNATQQEVILITGSRFANRQYCEKDNSENANNLSQEEKLREACWNGMLKEWLPEIFFMTGPEAKLFLWQMREAHHLLALQMAEQPSEVDHYNSIDPYCFMQTQGFS